MWTQEQNPGMEQLWGEGARVYDKRAPHAWEAATWLPCRETGRAGGWAPGTRCSSTAVAD